MHGYCMSSKFGYYGKVEVAYADFQMISKQPGHGHVIPFRDTGSGFFASPPPPNFAEIETSTEIYELSLFACPQFSCFWLL